jgi:purine nucleosidase
MDRIPVLLDTDPGSDIDDALVISYLLRKKECELLGITTVTGPVEKRAAIAEVLCHAAGRKDVPIHCGRSEVLVYGPGQPNCPHYDAIAKLPHRLDRKANEAVEFMRKTIRSRPGEITLLGVGPMQNIALLFALDPEIPHLLKEFVSMAGVFALTYESEWNCASDPVATAIVAHSKRPRHYWVGLDVTTQCWLDKEQCHERFKGPLLDLVLKMAGDWFDRTPRMVFHDPLAAASVFNPGLITFEQGRVSVNHEKGQTTFTAGEGNDLVATKVDPGHFFEEYFKVVR